MNQFYKTFKNYPADTFRVYISPEGNDDSSGTKIEPKATLKGALALVLENTKGRHAEIHLAEGHYAVSEPIIIDQKQLTEVLSLSFIGAGEAVLTGTVPLTPQWESTDGGIYRAAIEKGLKIDALCMDFKPQIMARYPNYQSDICLNGYAADALSPERTAHWSNPAGGYIRALHHAEWGSNSYRILGKNSTGKLDTQWVGDNNRGSQMHKVKQMVENIFEELDAPREWYYDPTAGYLYYIPEAGVNPSQHRFDAVVSAEFFRLEGSSPEESINNIRFENLRFKHTARTLFTGTYERPLRGDWGIVRAGVIFSQNSKNISVNHCVFEDIGGNAVTFSGYNHGHCVNSCAFTAIGATGILIAGFTSAVRDYSEYDGDSHKTVITDFIPGPASEDYPRLITLSHNYFYDIGTFEKQTAAICLCISSEISILRNTIHRTSRAGLNINSGAFGGHLIEGNDIFDCVRETADHGPFNSWGRDRYWSVPEHDAMGYHGRRKRPFALLDAWKTTVVRGNRVHANHAFGLDFDDGTSNYEIYNNLCVGVGIKLRDGFDRRVYNNLLIGAGFELHMSFAQNNDLIYSNVVYFNKAYNSLCVSEDATTIFACNSYWNGEHPVSGLPENEENPCTENPLFTDLAGGDYSLAPNSPAFSRGFVNFPMTDRDFGCPDKPKPPVSRYIPAAVSEKAVLYRDLVLTDVDSEGVRSAAGLPDYEGAFVLSRDVLGIFCELGLPIGSGDVIISLNGVKIQNAQHFVDVFTALPTDTLTETVIYRSQAPLKLQFLNKQLKSEGIAQEAIKFWSQNKPNTDLVTKQD